MSAKSARRGPTVVLVGRPNVGKSTLFNRVIGSRRAIVTAVPGTTRDVLAQTTDWRGVTFRLVDTGGMFGASADPLHKEVASRGRAALRTATLIVFVVDGREGPVASDEEIAQVARVVGVPVVLAVNKTDDRRARGRAMEFHRFGFEPLVEIAAEHGLGIGDLLDEIVDRLPGRPASTAPAETEGAEGAGVPGEISVAVVGRPNVGKSSLVNRLLRQERMLVSEMPGTTRDAVDEVMAWHRRQFRIVDTAGIRRPGRVARSGPVEAVSVVVARRAMAAVDVAVLVVDALGGATAQDAAIVGEADRAGCGIVIAANKWDLVKREEPAFATRFDEGLQRQLKFVEYAPVIHTSALTGERTTKLLETIQRVAEARQQRVSTGELNRLIEAVTAAHPPPGEGRRKVRILYATQTRRAPPSFVFFTNSGTKFHFSYARFLTNRLRDAFGFVGTPIRLAVRRRKG